MHISCEEIDFFSLFPHTPTLFGENYNSWYLRMKYFLPAQECWDTLSNNFIELTQEQLAAMKNNQRNVTAQLRKKEHKATCWI